MRIIDGDELVMWLSKWMTSSFGQEPTEETEAIRKVCDAVGDMVKELERENKDGDLISRQAAIEALYDWSEHSMTVAEAWHIRQVIGDIKSMPPAQPEIIRCKDCKYWMRTYLSISGKHGCNVIRDYTAPDDYCFKAER